MEFDFNIFYKLSVLFMKLNRSHPDIARDRKWCFQFILMHGLYTFLYILIIYSTVTYEIKIKDFSQACANGVIAVLYNLVTFGYCMMLIHQNSLTFIINRIQRDYFIAGNLSTEEQVVVFEYAKRGKSMIMLWLSISFGVTGLFILKSVILMVYYAIIQEFRLVPVYELKYPAALEDSRDNLVSFILLYITMVWYGAYTTFMYIGLTPLGPIFMIHACGQLELVRNRVLTLFPDYDYNVLETRKKLRDIIKQLQDIYCFVDHINTSFQLIYELSLKGTIITLPLLIYQILQTAKNGKINMEFVTITIGSLAFSSCPCYYSDLLLEMGENLRQAVYCSGWEKHCDRSARNSLLIIMIRTIRPVAARAMFRNLCLHALTDVFQSAYRIFSLLNAVW